MIDLPYTADTVMDVATELQKRGFGYDITWSENAGMPVDADDMALEAIYVICNSGMKHNVAAEIFRRVTAALQSSASASTAFRHPAKAKAIDQIWGTRGALYAELLALPDDAARIEWCDRLPHVGPITKFHLAKNFGVDVAKPDVHLQRLADLHEETVADFCRRLAGGCGLKARTVDMILWRACAIGLIDSRTGALR